MYQIKCSIEGVVPLLMCRYPMPEKQGQPSPRKGRTDIDKELESKAYVDDKGLYLPSDNIRMCLIGNQFRTGAAYILGSSIERKNGKKYRDFCKSCVWVVSPEEPIEKVYFEPHRETWDDVDTRSFITANAKRDVCSRPMIRTPWSLSFIIHVTDDTFAPGKIREFYDVAGLRCGLGVYGPTFGRFIVSEWEPE
jgi:hypothetical protein